MPVAVSHGERRRLGDLKPHPQNSRLHSPEQIDLIADAMAEWDWTVPILIDEGDQIIAGHGRQLAGLKKYGADYEVPVSVAEGWSDEQKRAYIIADNRLTELGTWDRTLLQAELTALDSFGFNLGLTGFDLADFGTPSVKDPDAVPDAPDVPTSKLGDVWVLGNHRIICGDSTDAATVEKVLAGAKPHLMVTDPPYGVEYDAAFRNGIVRANGTIVGARAVGKVLNDDRADWREAWALFAGDVAYVWHAGIHAAAVSDSLVASGFEVRSQIIWAKQQFAIGRGDYHWQHEPCWYVVRKGRTGRYRGGRKQSTLWEIDKPQKSETGHSTQKPVECMQRPMENNSKAKDAVYDPFLGSGTTVIAAEITGRRCYGIELSPAYVDVAVRRWEEFTGKLATNESGGTFAEVTAARLVSA